MSFLSDYLDFNSGNEAHPNYHLWSGLVVLSSVVTRRVWLNLGHFMVYGNIYVVLVGSPGNRKTTALNAAKKMMREIGGITFSAEAVTKEGLVKAMAEAESQITINGVPKMQSPLTIAVTELKEFLSSSSERMINVVTTIYDQDYYDYKTRNKEDITITNPYLTILACETPEWITLRLKDDVISGGFSRRALWDYEIEDRKRIAFPTITEADQQKWNRALGYAQSLKNVVGEMVWEPDAKSYYANWYEKLKIPQDPALVGYYRSKHMQALKVAMLVGLSESHELVMRKSYFLAALDFLNDMEKNLGKVFEGMGRNELNSVTSKILELLAMNNDPMTEKQLRAVTWKLCDGREFGQIMEHLASADKVTMWKRAKGTPNERTFIALKGREPADVQQALARADGQAQGSLPEADLSAGRSLTQNDLMNLLQPNQRSAPTASGGATNSSPKDG